MIGTEVPAAKESELTSPARRVPLVIVALGVAIVLLASFGTWALVQASALRTTAAASNAALVDRAATKSVQRAVSRAVNTVFSYRYTDVAATRSAAQHLLTGAAIRQYDQLFGLVERQAPKARLVIATKVTATGVELLTGGRARVLVFANQQDTRAGTRQASYGGAMFAVTAVLRHGRWLIADIDTFTSSG
jgi:Mce-associated membrane protein